MHIILHALSLLVVVKCVAVMNIKYQRSKLRGLSKTQHHRALTNATPKIPRAAPKISILHKTIPKSEVVQHKIGATW